jgi:hypothetical protein
MKNMTTRVIFNIDSKLKIQAMKKAQSEGLPFGAVLKLATKAFVEGVFDVGLVPKEGFNTATRKVVSKAFKDIKTGRNLSSRFATAKDAVAYLKS